MNKKQLLSIVLLVSLANTQTAVAPVAAITTTVGHLQAGVAAAMAHLAVAAGITQVVQNDIAAHAARTAYSASFAGKIAAVKGLALAHPYAAATLGSVATLGTVYAVTKNGGVKNGLRTLGAGFAKLGAGFAKLFGKKATPAAPAPRGEAPVPVPAPVQPLTRSDYTIVGDGSRTNTVEVRLKRAINAAQRAQLQAQFPNARIA